MERSEQKRFEKLYQKHLTTLKLRGKSQSTIDLYSRPLRRMAAFFGSLPRKLKPGYLKTYYTILLTLYNDAAGMQRLPIPGAKNWMQTWE